MSRKSGETIDVARVISTGQDRKTGHAVLRLRTEDGRMVALRLRPQQFRTLAKGVLGLAAAREERPVSTPPLERRRSFQLTTCSLALAARAPGRPSRDT